MELYLKMCYSLRKKTNTNMKNCEHLLNVDIGHMGVSWIFVTLVCVLGFFYCSKRLHIFKEFHLKDRLILCSFNSMA